MKDCTDVLSFDSEDHSLVDFSKTFFVGYTGHEQCSEQVLKWLSDRSYHYEDKISKLRFMKWLVDIFHPIDELSDGYSADVLHPFIRKQLRDYLDTNPVPRVRVVDWDDFDFPGQENSTPQLNESVAQLTTEFHNCAQSNLPRKTLQPSPSSMDDVESIDPLFLEFIKRLNTITGLPEVNIKENQRSRERFFSTIGQVWKAKRNPSAPLRNLQHISLITLNFPLMSIRVCS